MSKIYKKEAVILSWCIVLIWMGVIFYLSGQVASQSADLSTSITEWIANSLREIFANFHVDMDYFNHIMRKNAHFIAYLLLGVMVCNAIKTSGVRGAKGNVIALIICVIYAMSDEFHQLFVPGRSGEFRDILIDSIGATLGVGIYGFFLKRIVNRK